MMTAGAMSADFLHNFTFLSLLRPAMRGSTPDPTGVPPDGATLTSARASPQVGPGNRDQGVTEPV
jgi:hypothetical protein